MERRRILHGINGVLPDRTAMAVIGPSGSGRIIFRGMITRFWNVDSGSVKSIRRILSD